MEKRRNALGYYRLISNGPGEVPRTAENSGGQGSQRVPLRFSATQICDPTDDLLALIGGISNRS
jgi:hypothetical protein